MTSFRQLSFSGGEITPAVWGRVDQVKHSTGLELCKNFFVMRHGGVANRPGTKFIAEVSDSSKAVRLIPFIFNNNQTYILEFGEEYMRVILDGVHVKDKTLTITGATQANPCVITSTAHGLSAGDEVYITGVEGMIELNVRNFKVANITTNTFSLEYMEGDGSAVNSTSFTAYSSAGTAERVYTIATPYQETDLSTLYYTQSADVVYIVHPSYEPCELSRSEHAVWDLEIATFGPIISAPAGLASDSAGTTYYYVVTAIDEVSGEESLPSAEAGSTSRTSTLSWTAVVGASYYNVYYKNNGVLSWIGIAGSNSFLDATLTSDPLDNPPTDRTLFASEGNYPSSVTFYQQRLMFGNTSNTPETIYGSKSTLRKNFLSSSPLQYDDAVTFSLFGQKVNSIRHMISMAKLLVLTDSGEWVIDGDASGIITPFDINPRQHTANGAGTLIPLIVEGSALYVQARGSVIRDLNYDFQQDGYRGNELSIFSSHLFDQYTMVDWAYQQIPHSIVWIARSDGKLLGMTYVREHSMFGWHQHEFDGEVENVCVIPEGSVDTLYLTIKRTINGNTVRHIEALAERDQVNVEDYIFMDDSLSYNGVNTDTSVTMTLTSAGDWDYPTALTLTASDPSFSSGDVGNSVFLYIGTDLIRANITGYTSTTVVTVLAHKDVPVAFQSVATGVWSLAVDQVSGLWHLEGEDVSVLGDGFVVSNPNNDSYTTITVTDGTITLDIPYAIIHVGLPVKAEMQTLSIDTDSVVLTDKSKQSNAISLQVKDSRGIFAGLDADNITEFKIRSEEDYDSPIDLQTGVIDLNIASTWDKKGSVYITQIDPLPASILAAIPAGYMGK